MTEEAKDQTQTTDTTKETTTNADASTQENLVQDTTKQAPEAKTEKVAEQNSNVNADTTKTESKGDKPKPDAVTPIWGDDWREKMAGGNPDLMEMLKRYTTPEAVTKALNETKKKAREKTSYTLPEDATPEQVAAYRDEVGIPEEPQDYDLGIGEDRSLNDIEKKIIDDFKVQAHKENIPPLYAKKLTDWFLNMNDAIVQQELDKDIEIQEETMKQLKAEWGRDCEPYIEAVNTYVRNTLGVEGGEVLLETKIAGGGKLGNNAAFIKLLADASITQAGYDPAVGVDTVSDGRGIQEQIDELMKMKDSTNQADRDKYWGKETQDKINKLYALREKKQK